jgi:hypothetical protein
VVAIGLQIILAAPQILPRMARRIVVRFTPVAEAPVTSE